ncbi:hypothetical protein V2J09_002360 [Rumex salicifolius]
MDQLQPRPANSPSLTPLTFLERAATVYGDRPSLIYNDAVVSTWQETHLRCLRLASSLRSLLAIRPGDVISAFLPNLPSMLELHFAVPMSGAVLNNLNTRLDPRTISVLLRHSAATALVVDSLSLPTILSALSLLPQSHSPPALIIVDDGAGPNPDPRYTCYNYEDLVSRGDPEFEWVRPRSEWDPIVLNYTSGTTSDPKGVVHSHRGAFVIAVDSIIGWPLPETPVYLWTLPMFHVNGWSFAWAVAAVGAACICMRKFDAGDIYAAIRHHGVTHMCGAPVVLNMLSNAPEARKLERPVHVLTAGAPPPATVLFKTEELGFVVSHGYGLTETGGLVVTCAWKAKWNAFPATERARLKARQGVRTLGMTSMDVIDSTTGKLMKHDGQSAGEIVLRGASLMLGYLKDPVGTAKSMGDDGWFKTGDVGVIHPDGYLEIKDRSKDVIISGGENISSVEVESVLYTNPAVNEAAVVARPDEHWGETPCAFVSLKAGLDKKPTEAEIIEYCRAKMARFMVPKTVVFMDELPKTSTGKVQKFVLRDAAKAMGSSRTSRL